MQSFIKSIIRLIYIIRLHRVIEGPERMKWKLGLGDYFTEKIRFWSPRLGIRDNNGTRIWSKSQWTRKLKCEGLAF